MFSLFLMIFLVLLILLLGTINFIMAIHHNGYWARRRVPTPPNAKPFIGHLQCAGNMYQMLANLVNNYQKWGRQLGSKYFGIQEGAQNVMIVWDAELVKQIYWKHFNYFDARFEIGSQLLNRNSTTNLILLKGAEWKKHRAMATKAFSMGCLKKILQDYNAAVLNAMAQFDGAEFANNLDCIVKFVHTTNWHFLAKMALDYVLFVHSDKLAAETTFSEKCFRNEIAAMAEKIYSADLGRLLGKRQNLMYSGAYLFSVCCPQMCKLLQPLVDKMRAPPKRNPFSELCEAIEHKIFAEIVGDLAEADGNNLLIPLGEIEQPFLMQALFMHNVVSSMSFRSYGSAIKKICQQIFDPSNCFCRAKIQAEFSEVMGSSDEQEAVDPNYEQLNKLPYLDAAIKEALRLSPSDAQLADLNRVCTREVVLTASDGVQICFEPGVMVRPDIYSLHYDRDIFGQDADKFRPERWLTQAEKAEDDDANANASNNKIVAEHDRRYAFLAFGAGRRICIAERMNVLLSKVAIKHILYAIEEQKEKQKWMNESINS